MTRKKIAPLIGMVIIALLLGGAFLIVSRNGPSPDEGRPAGFVH